MKMNAQALVWGLTAKTADLTEVGEHRYKECFKTRVGLYTARHGVGNFDGILVMPVMLMTCDIMFLAAEIMLQPTQLRLQLFERLSLRHMVGMVFQIAAP